MEKFIYLPLLFILILSGCSADYKKLSKMSYSSSNAFNKIIIEEYTKFAHFEAKEMHDWNSAKLYSQKAILSYSGKNVKPEPIESWGIDEKFLPQLEKAYDDLIIIYDKGLNNDPVNLAKAISSLDCWAEQQEEGWQLDHIEKCKSNFLNSINQINNKLAKTKYFDQNNNLIEKIIYFDFNSYEVSKEKIIEIKKYLTNNNVNRYMIIGHADTKGTKVYNYELSKKRADSLKKILISYGIKSENINVVGKGESILAVPTPDETAHPANRRASINPSY